MSLSASFVKSFSGFSKPPSDMMSMRWASVDELERRRPMRVVFKNSTEKSVEANRRWQMAVTLKLDVFPFRPWLELELRLT